MTGGMTFSLGLKFNKFLHFNNEFAMNFHLLIQITIGFRFSLKISDIRRRRRRRQRTLHSVVNELLLQLFDSIFVLTIIIVNNIFVFYSSEWTLFLCLDRNYLKVIRVFEIWLIIIYCILLMISNRLSIIWENHYNYEKLLSLLT